MSKLITTEDGYEIRLGQKNPTCYPCCFEGSVCACRSDHSELLDAIQGFDVMIINGSRNPLFVS